MTVVRTLDAHFLKSGISDPDLVVMVGVFIAGLDRKFGIAQKNKESIAGVLSVEEFDCLVALMFS